MQTAKQEVSRLLTHLPDDCSLEDIQYHLYVLQKIKRGLSDAKEGRVYPQEEVENRNFSGLSACLKPKVKRSTIPSKVSASGEAETSHQKRHATKTQSHAQGQD